MARKSRKNTCTTDVAQVARCKTYDVGVYVRLSAVDRKQKGDSIETQQAIIKAFIDERSDLRLTEIYIDNGLSGQSFERPAFKRMIADMESGKINCCVTKDLSRFGRNAIDSGYYIEKYFPSINVRFMAINDNYDSADGQSGGMMVSLKNMINETYALDVSRKIRATVQMNISKGCFIGGLAPYGYLKSEDDCHKLVVDENAARIVRHIFEMAADGHNAKTILAWLNDSRNGILSPSRYLCSIGKLTENRAGVHNNWSWQAVQRTLQNRMYCGDMVQGKEKSNGYSSKKLLASEWTVTENTHEAIVDRELFSKAQRFFSNSYRPRNTSNSILNTENVFSKKVFCGDCGFVISRTRTSNNYFRFRCNTKSLYSVNACDGTDIMESTLKKKLFSLLSKYKPFLSQSMPVSDADAPNNSVHADELKSVCMELERNQNFLKGLYESLFQGDITDSEYLDLKGRYENKVAGLTEREKWLRNDAIHQARRNNELTKANDSLRSITNPTELTAEAIDRLVETIHIYKDKRIRVKFMFMDEVVNSWEDADNE